MEIKEDNEKKKFIGWGSWAGIGIEQIKISEDEKIKKKKFEIVIS